MNSQQHALIFLITPNHDSKDRRVKPPCEIWLVSHTALPCLKILLIFHLMQYLYIHCLL